MVTPQQVAEAIRDFGVDLRPYPYDDRPWHTFTTPGGWNPIGVMHHHTAGSSGVLVPDSLSQQASLRLLRIGRSDLSGPLCHFAPTYAGPGKRVAYAIGWGNVNHAGTIAQNVVNAVEAQVFLAAAFPPGADAVDGNPLFYGLEYLHPGDATPWPDELLDTGHRVAAGICQAHGWTHMVNVEHREATKRKIDRSWVHYGAGMRTAVKRLLEGGTMPSAEDIARVVLNSPVNPQAPEAEQVSVRTALRRVLTAPEPVSEATIRSIASQAARQAVADLLATLPDNIDMENACARALAAQVTVEQETLSRTEVQKAVAIAMREVLGSLDETEMP